MSGNPRPARRVRPDPVDAETVVKTPFVSGRIHLALHVVRLESWANAPNRLDAGEDVAWTEMSRGPSIFIRLTGRVTSRRQQMSAHPRVRKSSWMASRISRRIA
ncbi:MULTISPECIES: DUF5959 family protein [Streptomyces]|uniref:DUF5959 family protein n=1 Tax=Streptomyces TaxID=1883 RepID=UPI00367F1B32